MPEGSLRIASAAASASSGAAALRLNAVVMTGAPPSSARPRTLTDHGCCPVTRLACARRDTCALHHARRGPTFMPPPLTCLRRSGGSCMSPSSDCTTASMNVASFSIVAAPPLRSTSWAIADVSLLIE